MKSITTIFSFSFLSVLLSCVSNQGLITNEPIVETQPKLLFLNYEITKTKDAKTISLINQITTDGQLKQRPSNYNIGKKEDLKCVVLDINNNALETHLVPNPLKQTIEFINDSGNFENKILDLERAEFSLKLQLQSKAKFVQIQEITATGIIEHSITKIQ